VRLRRRRRKRGPRATSALTQGCKLGGASLAMPERRFSFREKVLDGKGGRSERRMGEPRSGRFGKLGRSMLRPYNEFVGLLLAGAVVARGEFVLVHLAAEGVAVNA